MRKLILGFILAIFLACLYFIFYPDSELRPQLMRLLDYDILYLKNGGIIQETVFFSHANVVTIGKGLYEQSDGTRIEEDVFLRYLRDLM